MNDFKKRYKFCYFYILLIIVSCSSKEKGIELEILNEKINYSHLTTNEENYISEDDIINYKNISNSLQSSNIVNWRIKNNTPYDYFFFMEYNTLSISGEVIYPSEYIYFNITDSLSKTKPIFQGQIIKDDSLFFKKYDLMIDLQKVNEKIKESESLPNSLTDNNYFILASGEEIMFTNTVFLPIVIEPKINNDFLYSLVKLENKKYNFNLTYYANLKMYKKYFSLEDLKYLEKNNIKPFVGKLESNKILLVPQ